MEGEEDGRHGLSKEDEEGEGLVAEADRSMDHMVDCHVVDGAAAAGDA
mgnify:CR=1 FL=1